MAQQLPANELWLTNDAFPQGRLLESYYDRDVTRLSDRGLASNMIGDRWSDLCADATGTWPASTLTLPDGMAMEVSAIYRLDAIPEVARVASRRGLQNPDYIATGYVDGQPVNVAIDAKFSIDTAKISQVSGESLAALLDVGQPITSLLPAIDVSAQVRDGYFLSPNAPLTHYVLDLRRGRLAARVPRDRVLLLGLTPVQFIRPLQGARLLGTLATMEGLRQEIRGNLLLAMYYFRLVRACYGAYTEANTPLLGADSRSDLNELDLEQTTVALAHDLPTSWDVVMAWDARAERVRRQREAVHAAMNLPVHSRELRERIAAASTARGQEAPSLNSVRRALGSWYRQQFDATFGTVAAPVEDLPLLLTRIHARAATLAPEVGPALDRLLDSVLSSRSATEQV